VRFELDQSHCTVSTKLRRVLLLHEAGALEGKRILLLGDDDLMSVAIDRVSRTLGFAGAIDELSVVDVDPAVLAFCRTRLATAPFRVKLFEHDLRNPLPDELTGRFDTIFTDPPYTPTGAEVFLSRAAAALDCLRAGHVFFCFGMKPADATLRVQSAIADMGFVIRRVFKNFNEYYGSGTVAGVSNLYHLTSSSATTPRIGAFHAGPLYTGDEHRARRYRCMTCHAVAIVGHDQVWTTIGGLKSSGCPRCGGPTFRPLPRTSA
jgi:predicted methyltransferase